VRVACQGAPSERFHFRQHGADLNVLIEHAGPDFTRFHLDLFFSNTSLPFLSI
jgi:hypothetical protein